MTSRAWTDEEARKFTAPCVDRPQWDAWLTTHDARVRRDARAEAFREAASIAHATHSMTEVPAQIGYALQSRAEHEEGAEHDD